MFWFKFLAAVGEDSLIRGEGSDLSGDYVNVMSGFVAKVFFHNGNISSVE